MKLSTRARYGLRMMIEMARELKNKRLVQMSKISKITGISENYLAQLAIPIKAEGLLIGVSGKKGGYHLSRPADEIKLSEIIKALIGPVNLTDCVANPDCCLYSSFCESRLIWVILSGNMMEVLDKYTLTDLIDKDRRKKLIGDYSHMELLYPDKVMSRDKSDVVGGCPDRGEVSSNGGL